jgi:hypothetical protein
MRTPSNAPRFGWEGAGISLSRGFGTSVGMGLAAGTPAGNGLAAAGFGAVPCNIGFSLNLPLASAFSPPAGLPGGMAPAGKPSSSALVRGPRSIFTFSPADPRGAGAFELIGGGTSGNSGTTIDSPARSGSEGLIEMRGLSLIEGRAALLGAAAMGSLGPGNISDAGVTGLAGSWSSDAVGSSEAGGVPSAALSERSRNFKRGPGGFWGSSPIQLMV